MVPGQVFRKKADPMTDRAIRRPDENHYYIENNGKSLFGINQGGAVVSTMRQRREYANRCSLLAFKVSPLINLWYR